MRKADTADETEIRSSSGDGNRIKGTIVGMRPLTFDRSFFRFVAAAGEETVPPWPKS